MSGLVRLADTSGQLVNAGLTPLQTSLPSIDQQGRLFIANALDTSVLTLVNQAANVNSVDLLNGMGKAIKIGVNITAISGTGPSLTLAIQGKDLSSGQYYTILTSAALNAVAFTLLTICPGMVAVANLTVNDFLPRTWRVACTIAGTTPLVSATIGASLVS
jgi:hypothetical protein